MIVLSIDPGIAHTGWAVIEFREEPKLVNFGLIKTTTKDGEDWGRATCIAQTLRDKVSYFNQNTKSYIHPYIDVLLIEKYYIQPHRKFTPKNGEKTIRVIQAIETLLQGLEIIEIDHSSVRPHRRDVEPIFQQLTRGVKFPAGDHVQDAIYQALVWYYYIYPEEKLKQEA